MEWRYDTYEDMWVSEGEVSMATLASTTFGWVSKKSGCGSGQRPFDRVLAFRTQTPYFRMEGEGGHHVRVKHGNWKKDTTLSSLITEMKDSENASPKGRSSSYNSFR